MEIKIEPNAKIDCGQNLVRAVRFNADGRYAITCGSDRTIKLWRPTKSLELKCYRGHSSDVTDSQANQDSSQLLSCSHDKSVILWDVESGKFLKRYRNFLAPFNTVCFGTNFTTALAGSFDGTVKIYDLKTPNVWDPIQSLGDAKDSVSSCRVVDNLIYTTSLDGCLRTYDVRQGKLAVDTFQVPLNYMSIGCNNKAILFTCLRGKPFLFDRSDVTILQEFEGSLNKMFKVEGTFVLNDSAVATGSEDGCAYVWGISSEQPKTVFKHSETSSQVVHSISSDTLDYLLTACGEYMFLWSL